MNHMNHATATSALVFLFFCLGIVAGLFLSALIPCVEEHAAAATPIAAPASTDLATVAHEWLEALGVEASSRFTCRRVSGRAYGVCTFRVAYRLYSATCYTAPDFAPGCELEVD